MISGARAPGPAPASPCARNVQGMQNGPADTERCGELQQLSWPGVAAAEIAMERCQGHWLADAVPQPHKVYDGACRVVDAPIFAGAASRLVRPSSKVEGSKRNTVVGGNEICGGRLVLGTAIWTAAGISSVRSCTAAADSGHPDFPPGTGVPQGYQRLGRSVVRDRSCHVRRSGWLLSCHAGELPLLPARVRGLWPVRGPRRPAAQAEPASGANGGDALQRRGPGPSQATLMSSVGRSRG